MAAVDHKKCASIHTPQFVHHPGTFSALLFAQSESERPTYILSTDSMDIGTEHKSSSYIIYHIHTKLTVNLHCFSILQNALVLSILQSIKPKIPWCILMHKFYCQYQLTMSYACSLSLLNGSMLQLLLCLASCGISVTRAWVVVNAALLQLLHPLLPVKTESLDRTEWESCKHLGCGKISPGWLKAKFTAIHLHTEP